MHEQLLRKEQDPFHKPESAPETASESAAAAAHRRVEAQVQREAQQQRTHDELMAPSVVAELPGQTGVSEEAVKRLYVHFSERARKGDLSAEEQEHTSATQTDPRTTAQSSDARGKLRPDNARANEFHDGISADFVTDSQIASAAIDEGPHGSSGGDDGFDVWEGTPSRRRKLGAASPPAPVKKREGTQ